MKRLFDFIKENKTISYIILAAIILRAAGIGAQNLWFDESYSWGMAKLDLSGIISKAFLFDVHPPLYYILLHFWINIFGDSIIAMRSLSVIPSIVSIIYIYKYVKENHSVKAALFSCFFISVSAYNIYFAAEARMYSLLACLTICSIYYYNKSLASDFTDKKFKTAFCFFIILGLYAHYSFFLLVFTLLLFFGISLCNRNGLNTRNKKDLIKRFSAAVFYIFLFCLPLVFYIINYQIPSLRSQNWRAPLKYGDLLYNNGLFLIKNMIGVFNYNDYIKQFEMKNIFDAAAEITIYLLNFCAIIYLAVKSYWRENIWKLPAHFSFLSVIALTALIFIVSNHAYYLDRYLFFISPLFAIIISLGFLKAKNSYFKNAAIGIIMFSYIAGLFSYYGTASRDSDHRPVFNILSMNYKANDIVVLSPPDILNMYLYNYRDSNRIAKFYSDEDTLAYKMKKDLWVVCDYRSGKEKYFSDSLAKSNNLRIDSVWVFGPVKLFHFVK